MAIVMAVPDPNTSSSATGESKFLSKPFNSAIPVDATPVSIPNIPTKYSSLKSWYIFLVR